MESGPFHAHSMCGTGVFMLEFHALYRCIPCAIQAYSMSGKGVFHAWYRHIPCVVKEYSMRGTGAFHAWYRCVFTVYSTGIPVHAPCTVQIHSQHIVISLL